MSETICDIIRGYKSNSDLNIIDFSKNISCYVCIFCKDKEYIYLSRDNNTCYYNFDIMLDIKYQIKNYNNKLLKLTDLLLIQIQKLLLSTYYPLLLFNNINMKKNKNVYNVYNYDIILKYRNINNNIVKYLFELKYDYFIKYFINNLNKVNNSSQKLYYIKLTNKALKINNKVLNKIF